MNVTRLRCGSSYRIILDNEACQGPNSVAHLIVYYRVLRLRVLTNWPLDNKYNCAICVLVASLLSLITPLARGYHLYNNEWLKSPKRSSFFVDPCASELIIDISLRIDCKQASFFWLISFKDDVYTFEYTFNLYNERFEPAIEEKLDLLQYLLYSCIRWLSLLTFI